MFVIEGMDSLFNSPQTSPLPSRQAITQGTIHLPEKSVGVFPWAVISAVLSQMLEGVLCLPLNNTSKDVRWKRLTRWCKYGSSPVPLTAISHMLPMCVLTCFAEAGCMFADLEVHWSSIEGKNSIVYGENYELRSWLVQLDWTQSSYNRDKSNPWFGIKLIQQTSR